MAGELYTPPPVPDHYSAGYLEEQLTSVAYLLNLLLNSRAAAAFRASGSDNITTAWAVVSLNTVLIADDNYSLDSNEVTVRAAGKYHVDLQAAINIDSGSGADNSEIALRVQGDNGGWTDFHVDIRTWINDTVGQGMGLAGSGVIDVKENEKLRLRIVAINTTDCSIEAATCCLNISRAA